MKEGVDVSDPEELAEALQDKELLDRVRDKATSEGALQVGTAMASILGRGRGERPRKPKDPGHDSDGHYSIPRAVWDHPDLSPEARRVFNNFTSGWYGELHGWSRPHREYNQGVQELSDNNKYNPAKMTEKDAWDFIRQFRSSRDPRIAKFRRMIDVKVEQYRRRHRGRL